MSKEPDRIFAQPLAQVPDFAFNEDVVRVFPDMIKRSVPGYPTIVENLGVLAAQFAQPNSVLYDLGSSLGAVTQALRRHVRTEGCKVIAVDNSAAMVELHEVVDGVTVFSHTVIQDAFEGRGLASTLVDEAIADVVARGGTFAATCSYVEHWLTKHHQHDDGGDEDERR